MNERSSSSLIEPPKYSKEKLMTLADILKDIHLEGNISKEIGIELFDNGNILLTITGDTLHYTGYPNKGFKLLDEEIKYILERLDLKNVNIIPDEWDGDSSHTRIYFALNVKFYK